MGSELDALHSGEVRGGWNWFPEHAEPPPSDSSASQSVLIENIVSIYESPMDWLNVTLVVAWSSPPDLLVNASVEVACWCSRDHGAHYVEDARWPVTTAADLLEAFADATSTVRQWVRDGPREPSRWRRTAGLPDSPDS